MSSMLPQYSTVIFTDVYDDVEEFEAYLKIVEEADRSFTDEKGNQRSVVRNTGYYFREGITYSAAGSKGVTFRYLPTNYIIDAGGPGIYPNEYKNVWYQLGFFNSKLVYYICDCLNPTVNINQGDLWRVPFAKPSVKQELLVEHLSKQNVEIKKSLCSHSIIEMNFAYSPISTGQDVTSSVVFKALILAKPATPTGTIEASVPPQSITS